MQIPISYYECPLLSCLPFLSTFIWVHKNNNGLKTLPCLTQPIAYSNLTTCLFIYTLKRSLYRILLSDPLAFCFLNSPIFLLTSQTPFSKSIKHINTTSSFASHFSIICCTVNAWSCTLCSGLNPLYAFTRWTSTTLPSLDSRNLLYTFNSLHSKVIPLLVSALFFISHLEHG